MSGNPAGFKEWLRGGRNYSDPPSWTCQISPNRVAIVPGWKFIVMVTAMLLVFGGGLGGLFWSVHTERDVFGIIGMLIGGCGGILAIGGFGTLLILTVLDRLKGPFFVYSPSDRTLSLPREALVVPKANVIGWRLISGNLIGAEGAQKGQAFPISELHLIVKTPDGPTAYAIVGSKAYSMTEQSRLIAQATGIPLEVLEQSQGVTEEPASRRVQNWRARGM